MNGLDVWLPDGNWKTMLESLSPGVTEAEINEFTYLN